MAVGAARATGLRVDESAAAEQRKNVQMEWASRDQPLLQRRDAPGGAEMLAYALFHMAAEGVAPDLTTDALVHNICGTTADGGQLAFRRVSEAPNAGP